MSAPAHTRRPPATRTPGTPDAAPAATRLVAQADRSAKALAGTVARRQDLNGTALTGGRAAAAAGQCSVPTDLEAHFCVSMATLSRVFQI
jgi:hypothetical protein